MALLLFKIQDLVRGLIVGVALKGKMDSYIECSLFDSPLYSFRTSSFKLNILQVLLSQNRKTFGRRLCFNKIYIILEVRPWERKLWRRDE